jgi:hypothetical protein
MFNGLIQLLIARRMQFASHSPLGMAEGLPIL